MRKFFNLTKEGNEATLRQVEKIMPDIKKDITALRALRDLERASNLKR